MDRIRVAGYGMRAFRLWPALVRLNVLMLLASKFSIIMQGEKSYVQVVWARDLGYRISD